MGIQHPLQHGPGHHRESGYKVHGPARRGRHTKPRYAVVAVGNNGRALGEDAHVEAMDIVRVPRHIGFTPLDGEVLHALLNQRLRLGVQH